MTPIAISKFLRGLISGLALVSLNAIAQPPNLKIDGAWARATVPGQKGTGAFMSLTAPNALKLVGVSSPVAGLAELHEMRMDGDVMRMRAIDSLDLPAGKKVELRPGGHHLMLMDLKQPLQKDTQVPVVLLLRDTQGQTSELRVSVPVLLGAPAVPSTGHGASHKH